MTSTLTLLVAAILWPAPAPVEAPPGLTGWASAYAPGRMAEVVRWRLDNDVWRTPPLSIELR